MFIFIISRCKGTHIVDYKYNNGRYLTICNKNFYQKNNIITLGADNIFENLCKDCRINYNKRYSYLKDNPRMIRDSFQRDITNLLYFHRNEIMGPRDEFNSVFERKWGKLYKIKYFSNNRVVKYGK